VRRRSKRKKTAPPDRKRGDGRTRVRHRTIKKREEQRFLLLPCRGGKRGIFSMQKRGNTPQTFSAKEGKRMFLASFPLFLKGGGDSLYHLHPDQVREREGDKEGKKGAFFS